MNQTEQKEAAKAFVERWQAAEGNEQREANSFWIELCAEVLGIANPTHLLDFERRVRTRRIDVFCEDRGILIENKSRGVDLDLRYERGKNDGGEGRMVTPYEQAKWYADNLPRSICPRWVLVCNFDEIRIHDMDADYPERDYELIRLEELPGLAYRLSFFTRDEDSRLARERDLSKEAGDVVGRLYEELSRCYLRIEDDPEEQRSLNILITRLVFLLYAEDAGLLSSRQQFYTYLKSYETQDMRRALIDLFDTLNTPDGTGGTSDERDPYLREKLKAFPYINGGLFADPIVIPQLTEDARFILLQEASAEFDWAGISPTIFGAVFESTLNPETRRSGGMHYTSIENIHKLIDPLFLDDLKAELVDIEGEKTLRDRNARLVEFQHKLASLRILDPAAGSGNFLTESYICLRRLENRVLENLNAEAVLDLGQEGATVEVGIGQLYGIEINDFAVNVARTALWIAEAQLAEETASILHRNVRILPLKSVPSIVCGNALALDWNEVLPARECDYVIGNPPFYGARMQSKEQKAELIDVFHGAKNCGNVDYVAGWYMKAAEYIADHAIRCAFVSTNSICQGEQVANVWKPIFDLGVRIDFAHDTFRWRNEANDQAHVFVVIVGFSKLGGPKVLFHHEGPDEEAVKLEPDNINAYLADAPDVFVWNRKHPICDVPAIGIGNKPIDGGNYLFKDDEMAEFLRREPGAERFFRTWIGSDEFLNSRPRHVLWLGDATPQDLMDLPLCRERIENVRQFRLASSSAPTQKLAESPTRFHVENMPQGTSILVPKVSSERREYIPLGFIGPDTFCSDLVSLIPNATLYHFGVLHSRFHNAWMRVVAGRLESRYRYSGGMVYNTFAWPDPTPEQKQRIEQCAQRVLDVRELYPGRTLAELYDPDKMPDDLRQTHAALDAAVEAAYNVSFNDDEERIVAHLFKLYAEATRGEQE